MGDEEFRVGATDDDHCGVGIEGERTRQVEQLADHLHGHQVDRRIAEVDVQDASVTPNVEILVGHWSSSGLWIGRLGGAQDGDGGDGLLGAVQSTAVFCQCDSGTWYLASAAVAAQL